MKMLLNKKKKKPVLKFNPGFALIGLQTNRPTRPLVQLFLGVCRFFVSESLVPMTKNTTPRNHYFPKRKKQNGTTLHLIMEQSFEPEKTNLSSGDIQRHVMDSWCPRRTLIASGDGCVYCWQKKNTIDTFKIWEDSHCMRRSWSPYKCIPANPHALCASPTLVDFWSWHNQNFT